MNEKIRYALHPTEAEISALPLASNAKAASDLIGKSGGRVLDIGCGDGKFTRSLTAHFSDVSGIDVKEKVITRAKAAASAEGKTVDFRVASGEALPWPDSHFDVVAFSNSLHHMPNPAKALAEAGRVLKRGGLLYVMEPVPSGNYHEATKLVNDETEVRTQAFEALQDIAKAGFAEQTQMMYRSRRSFVEFDEWKADQIDRDEKRRAKFDADPERVRSTFIDAAEREDGKLVYTQVFRVDLWKKN